MYTRLLIDAIVRQTTVLIAELSTASGLRAPLSHIANEVFLSLSHEIEAQGVGRKVAADMFGLALRTYQKKVQRLSESATEPNRTLWESILDFVSERGSATREQVVRRFSGDTDREIVGVLSDLVQNGLLHASGRGAAAVYGITSDAERHLFVASSDAESLGPLFWALVRGSSRLTTRGLADETRLELAVARRIVERLIGEKRLLRKESSDDAALEAAPLFVPLGTEFGWEASVLDHFRAVSNAIAAKLRSGKTRAVADDVVGGTTLSFKLYPGHPLAAEVRGLLSRTRRDSISLWERVEAENGARSIPEESSSRVWFYFGQYEEAIEEEA
jgi:hypothetical protein